MQSTVLRTLKVLEGLLIKLNKLRYLLILIQSLLHSELFQNRWGERTNIASSDLWLVLSMIPNNIRSYSSQFKPKVKNNHTFSKDPPQHTTNTDQLSILTHSIIEVNRLTLIQFFFKIKLNTLRFEQLPHCIQLINLKLKVILGNMLYTNRI